MNTTLKTITLAALAAGAIVLAGCTAQPTIAPTTTQAATPATTSTQAATPAPEDTTTAATPDAETPVDVADLETGAEIDAATAEALNAAIRTKGDDRAYELDGQYVLIKGGEPLPEKVTAAAQAAVAKSGLGTSTDRASRDKADAAFHAAKDAEEAKTGRSVVVVSHTLSYVDGSGYAPAWVVSEPGPVGQYGSRDAAVSAANQWVAKSAGTRAMLIVDFIN